MIELDERRRSADVSWLIHQSSLVLKKLRAKPNDYDRWMPSLTTMRSQLKLSHGDINVAIREAERVLQDRDIIERCYISAYNVALNLATASILSRFAKRTDVPHVNAWQDVLRSAVAHMDMRFGTIYEFGHIYNVLFLVARSGFVAEAHEDRRLKDVSLDEFLDLVMRVPLNGRQKKRIRSHLKAIVTNTSSAEVPA